MHSEKPFFLVSQSVKMRLTEKYWLETENRSFKWRVQYLQSQTTYSSNSLAQNKQLPSFVENATGWTIKGRKILWLTSRWVNISGKWSFVMWNYRGKTPIQKQKLTQQ